MTGHRAVVRQLVNVVASVAAAASLVIGCMPQPAAPPPPSLTLDASPQVLLEPQAMDWSYQRVSSPNVMNARIAHIRGKLAAENAGVRSLMAWPSATANWAPSGTYPGVSLTSMGCSGTDTLPNGMASTFPGGVASLNNRIFLLTKEGKFIRADKNNPTVGFTALNLNKTFSKTYVTLSPQCRRAYCLSDDGTLFIIDTVNMAVLATRTVAGGYGIAPALDPLVSAANDSLDVLYVPSNDGNVTKFGVNGTSPYVQSGPTVYPVATGITPISGTHKIAAPGIVLRGIIVIGDMASRLNYYNTSDVTQNVVYTLGDEGIEAPPAIEIQDGTYALTDPAGAPATVAAFSPIYAFVNVSTVNGPVCAWVNLISRSIYLSQPTYFDDGDLTRTADEVRDYNLASDPTTAYLVAKDGGNVSQDGTNMPDTGATWSNDYLKAAQTNLSGSAPVTYAAGDGPKDVAIDGAGNIWVVNENADTVTKRTPAGALLGTFAVGDGPYDLAIDAAGNCWVACYRDDQIRKLSSAGALLATYNVGDGPQSIDFDASGNLWVACARADQVQKLSSAGVVLGTYNVGGEPRSLDVDVNGNCWVSNYDTDNVTKLSNAGAVLGTYAVGDRPWGIGTDSLGNCWVASEFDDEIYKLSPTGVLLGTYALVPGATPRNAIKVDSSNNVWVTSSGKDTVQKFDSSGNALATITVGSTPYGLAIQTDGTAWVANEVGDSVTKCVPPGGGPVYAYLRFTDSNLASYAPGSRINQAILSLTLETTAIKSYPANIYSVGGTDADGSTGVYYAGTTNYWASNGGLTAANAPGFGTEIGTWLGGGIAANGTVNYASNTQYDWDVTAGLGGAFPTKHYAFGVRFDSTSTFGVNVYYPGGPLTANTGGTSPPYYAPKFRNNALNADPAAASGANDQRPLLTLDMSVARYIPQQSVKTAPVVDSVLKKVYVFNTNYLYCIDFTTPTDWVDTSATMTTTYNAAYWGRNGGATLNNKNAFIDNATSPVPTYDFSSIYVYNFYPVNGQTTAPPYADWRTAITKITLPLVPGTNNMSPTTGSPGSAVANTLTNNAVNSGLLSSPNACGQMIIDPFANTYTTGGGIYFALDATKMVYHFDP